MSTTLVTVSLARSMAIIPNASPIPPSTHTSGRSQRVDASLCFRRRRRARLLVGQLVPRTGLRWPQMAWSIEPPQFRQMTFAVSDMRAIVE
jgi:hypothetical protein